MTSRTTDDLDPSPKPSTSESNWGLFLLLVLVAVVIYAIFGDYGNRDEPQSKKTGTQAVQTLD